MVIPLISDRQTGVGLGDGMNILGLKKIEDDEVEECSGEFDWEISFTLEGSSEVCYDYVQDRDEMKAYLKALEVVKKWQRRDFAEQASQLQGDLQGFKELKKLMPNVDLSEDIAKAKKLLTDVNQKVRKLS